MIRQPDQNFDLQLFLENERGQVVYTWPVIEPVGGDWPTGTWPAEYWVRDMIVLTVTPDVPQGRFTLRAQWLPFSTAETDTRFSLGTITISP